MNRFYLTLALVFQAFAPSAKAGGWIGGGGELLRDGVNPWFIANTAVVKACITADLAHFHLAPGKTDLQHDIVEPALAYWQRELLKPEPPPDSSPFYLIVGTQRFDFGPCGDDTQLRFQFGVLSLEQIRGLVPLGIDPRQMVSMAIRTDYDRVNLRGRGFIYIAADSGELRPATTEMFDPLWGDAKASRLKKVLVHELGHVFGIPHTVGNGAVGNELMDAGYPELVVNKQVASKFGADLDRIPRFFSEDLAADASSSCVRKAMSARVVQFLGLPETGAGRCLAFTRRGETIDVFNFEWNDVGGAQPRRPLGTIELSQAPPFIVDRRNLARIYLSSDQMVLPMPQGQKSSLDLGYAPYLTPARTTVMRPGLYRPLGQDEARRVLVTILPGGDFKVAGQLEDGAIVSFNEAGG